MHYRRRTGRYRLAGVQVIPAQHDPRFPRTPHFVHDQSRVGADGIALRLQLGQALVEFIQPRMLRCIVPSQTLGLFISPFFSQQNSLYIGRQTQLGGGTIHHRQAQPADRAPAPMMLLQLEFKQANLLDQQLVFQQEHRLMRPAKLWVHRPGGFGVAVNRSRDIVFRL